MSFHCPPVIIRKPAPGYEAHDPGAVEQEDGRTFTAKSARDRIERSFMQLWCRGDVLKPLGEFKQRGLLMHPPRQCLLGSLPAGNIVLYAHGMEKPACAIHDARGSNFSPAMSAITPKD